MNLTGKVISYGQDYLTSKTTISLKVDENVADEMEELFCEDSLDITIKRHRDRRSLDANSYYWLLLTKLSKVLRTSTSELHNIMLANYGELEKVDGRVITVYLPDNEDVEKDIKQKTEYHLFPTAKVITNAKGEMVRAYLMLRGSSTYDTKEMSNLIGGLISECRSAEIPESEIMTPFEREKLKEVYGLE